MQENTPKNNDVFSAMENTLIENCLGGFGVNPKALKGIARGWSELEGYALVHTMSGMRAHPGKTSSALARHFAKLAIATATYM